MKTPANPLEDGWSPNATKFEISYPAGKKLTAAAIRTSHTDVIVLQEIENIMTLRLL